MQGATVDTTELLAQVDALQHQVDALQTQVSALKNHVHSFQVLDPPPWGIENMADLKLWMFDKQYAPDFSKANFPTNLNLLPPPADETTAQIATAYTSTPTTEPPPTPDN